MPFGRTVRDEVKLLPPLGPLPEARYDRTVHLSRFAVTVAIYRGAKCLTLKTAEKGVSSGSP